MATSTFDAALEAVEQLAPDEQAQLVDVVRRRLIEQRRQQIIADARDASAEHANGATRVLSVEEIMRELEL